MTVLDGVPYRPDLALPPEPGPGAVVDAGGVVVTRLPIDAGMNVTRWYGWRDGATPVCWSWEQVCAADRLDVLARIRMSDHCPPPSD